MNRLYQKRIDTIAARAKFDAIINAGMAALGGTANANLGPAGAVPQVDWGKVTQSYGNVLNDLRQSFGLPGEVFVNATVIGKSEGPGGRLDDHPMSL